MNRIKSINAINARYIIARLYFVNLQALLYVDRGVSIKLQTLAVFHKNDTHFIGRYSRNSSALQARIIPVFLSDRYTCTNCRKFFETKGETRYF